MENLIEISNLTFSRSGRLIYDDISLQIKKGQTTAIMGPSGIGKTTMLRLMGGQLVPDNGDVKFKGESIPGMRRNRLFEVRIQS
jgi:phospholipid/cholesterol/gamma-HCH transport system ATP-binding protein